MKCIIISTSSEIVYSWCDDDYQVFLQQSTITDDEFTDKNCFDLTSSIQILFLSLIASYDVLKSETGETFSFIECGNDFLVCFQKCDNFLYIGLAQSKVNQKDHVVRELGFVRKSVGFLFGPWGQSQFQTRQNICKKFVCKCINTLIETYILLSRSESSFLFEGIEEIKFSDDVLSPYKNVIQQCVGSFIKPCPLVMKNLQFVLLFAGSKILCFEKFSLKPIPLTTISLLQIITFLHSDLHSILNSSASNRRIKASTSESKDAGIVVGSVESGGAEQGNMNDLKVFPKSDVDCLFDNVDVMSVASSMITTTTRSVFDDDASVAGSGGVFSDSENKVEVPSTSQARDDAIANDLVSTEAEEDVTLKQFYSLPVFVTSKKHPFVPCQLSCFILSPSVKMVVVCKANNAVISDSLCALLFWLRILNSLIDGNEVHVNPAELEDKMKKSVKSLVERAKKVTRQDVKGIVRSVKKIWHDGQQDVKLFLQNKNLVNLTDFAKNVREMERKLHLLHKLLYPSCIDGDGGLFSMAALNKIYSFVHDNLSCYLDFLHVKSQQNVPIFPYIKKFPGLVYFAFVKRVARVKSAVKYHDVLFVPSLSSVTISSRIGLALLSSLHKEIRCFNNKVNTCLVNKKAKLVCKQNGLQFASTVVSTGKDIDFSHDATVVGDNRTQLNYASPSLFSGDYYEHCFATPHAHEDSSSYIYQLITVHYDSVPIATIFKQREQLFAISSAELNSNGMDV